MKAPVRTEREGPVFIVEIDRPERRNAVDRETAEQLAAAFRRFDATEEAAVAVLSGSEDCFCSGADLKAASEGRANRLEPTGDGPMGPTRLSLQKPVIAAVEGYCVAGGLELALWCDLRVAAETATFGVFCRRFGVPLIDGGTVRLPRLIGLSRALDLILSGRAIDGRTAFDWGLANRLVSPGETRTEAIAWAHELARHPQLCLRADLASAKSAFDGSMEERLQAEFARGLPTFDVEGRRGAAAFARGAGRHGEELERDPSPE